MPIECLAQALSLPGFNRGPADKKQRQDTAGPGRERGPSLNPSAALPLLAVAVFLRCHCLSALSLPNPGRLRGPPHPGTRPCISSHCHTCEGAAWVPAGP